MVPVATLNHVIPTRQRWLAAVAFVHIACAVACCAESESVASGQPPVKRISPLTPAEEARVEQAKAQVYESIHAEDQAGFERLPKPFPGEWLAEYREFPQTVERFAAVDAKWKPSADRRTIVLQPLGEFSRGQREMLEVLRVYAEHFFQLPVRLEKPIELKVEDPSVVLTRQVPMGARHDEYYRQFDASVILKEILGKRVPADALVYVGITNEDLWVGKLNYLFGLGSFNDPTAVLSLCRYFPEFSRNERVAGDEVQVLRRAMKILNHETSHVFGLRHCIFYQCSMNGCNSMPELDAQPIFLCPVCHRKLRGLLGWDSGKRYDDLSSFYQQHGLFIEATWAAKRAERWRKVESRERAARGVDDE